MGGQYPTALRIPLNGPLNAFKCGSLCFILAPILMGPCPILGYFSNWGPTRWLRPGASYPPPLSAFPLGGPAIGTTSITMAEGTISARRLRFGGETNCVPLKYFGAERSGVPLRLKSLPSIFSVRYVNAKTSPSLDLLR